MYVELVERVAKHALGCGFFFERMLECGSERVEHVLARNGVMAVLISDRVLSWFRSEYVFDEFYDTHEAA